MGRTYFCTEMMTCSVSWSTEVISPAPILTLDRACTATKMVTAGTLYGRDMEGSVDVLMCQVK